MCGSDRHAKPRPGRAGPGARFGRLRRSPPLRGGGGGWPYGEEEEEGRGWDYSYHGGDGGRRGEAAAALTGGLAASGGSRSDAAAEKEIARRLSGEGGPSSLWFLALGMHERLTDGPGPAFYSAA